MKKIASVALLAFAATIASPLWAQPVPQVVLAQDTRGTPDERAAQLLAQLTPQEKIALLSGKANGFVTYAIPRLGIPAFTMADGPGGVRNPPAPPAGQPANVPTSFPAGAGLASTFDPALAAAYGKAVGLEDRAFGVNFQLGPGLNICRVPVNGRNFEYFGEDPYLASIIAVNWVKACSAQGSVPTIKHFAANNQETDRNSVNAIVDERTMHEIYLPAFKKAAIEGGISAIMCSYNRLNGSYASNNDWLLNQTLKNEWGFKGLVMSDWGASHNVTDLARGLDLEMPSAQNLNPAKINAALADGSVKPADLDHAILRLLRTAAAQGWLDAGYQQRRADLPRDSAESDQTALAVAQSAIVLLKNDRNTLPLDRTKIKNIVVLGPNATAANGRAPANANGGGSGAVTPAAVHYETSDYLKSLVKAAGPNIKVTYLPMTATPPAEDPAFNTLANAHTANGDPGLTLTVAVAGNPPATIAASTQKSINLTWQAGQLPLDVPAGRDATYTWSGVLSPAQDGDWQLQTAGATATFTIDGKPSAAGDILHLKANQPTPISIQLHAQANPPAGRGRGGNATNFRAALTPPAIPDLAAAKSADAVIVCVGLTNNVESEGRDRPFELPAIQQYLIQKATAANTHTIVVTNGGAAIGMTSWEPATPAILHAWYLGQEGGTALAQTLFGEINPSGRLCSTFDRTFEENPASAYYPGTTPAGSAFRVEPYTEGIFYGYRGYDKAGKAPLYPFGYGLSYTRFAMSNLKIDKDGTGFKVSVDVKNTGDRAGADVVQIYVGEKGCPLPRPLRELKGFAKVSLKPGETQHAEIPLPRDSFAYWSPEKKGWTVDTGNTFTIEAAESERDIKLQGTVVAQ